MALRGLEVRLSIQGNWRFSLNSYDIEHLITRSTNKHDIILFTYSSIINKKTCKGIYLQYHFPYRWALGPLKHNGKERIVAFETF